MCHLSLTTETNPFATASDFEKRGQIVYNNKVITTVKKYIYIRVFKYGKLFLRLFQKQVMLNCRRNLNTLLQ